MNKKRILFVCSANVHRSVTAEELYRDDPRYEVRSRGINDYARVRRQFLTPNDLEWAEMVFVMDKGVTLRIKSLYEHSNSVLPLIDLGVRDAYETSIPEEKEALVKVLREKLAPHLGEPQPK